MSTLVTDYDQQPWVHYQAALKVARLLAAKHFDAYLVGGAVRDIWLGRLPKDFDLVTNAKPDQVLALPGLVAAHYADPAQAYGVARVKVDVDIRGQHYQSTVEVATYRRDLEAHLGRKATKVEFAHLEDDVLRRDFTINALALDLANDYLVDYVDGLADLNAKLVRFIGEPGARIKEDPLRILRAIRFKTELKFDYTSTTKLAIKQAIGVGLLDTIPKERLYQELTLMLVSLNRVASLTDMLELGLLEHLLPEVSQLQGTAQPPQYHSEGDVWRHTLLALSYLPSHSSPRLVWATLLHDIGKPATVHTNASSRVEFPAHYEVGAQMAETIASRLGFSKSLARDVSWMVRYHMGIDDLPKMRAGRRQAFLAHPAFKDLLTLHKADAQASWRVGSSGRVDQSLPRFPLLDRLAAEHAKLVARPLPSLKRDIGVDGQWLMHQLNLSPGPLLGQILKQLNEAYLDGEIKNQDQALALAKTLTKIAPK